MQYRLKIIGVLLCLLWGCSGSDDLELIPITSWKQMSDFPGGARASASAFVIDNKAYVCCGRGGLRTDFLKDVWEYDSHRDTWIQKADFPGVARVKPVAVVIGVKAYVGLGGVSPIEGNQYADFWEYNSVTDRWKQLATFPGKAKTYLCSAVVDSCVYVTSGFGANSFNQDTYKYDPKQDTWTRLTDFPVSRSSVTGFVIGDDFFVGSGYQLEACREFYCYKAATDTWSRVADLPEGRILSSGITLNNKGYVMLGRNWRGSLNGGKCLKDIVRYDPLENKWVRCGDFPGGARMNAVAFTINGSGYVVGGEDDTERKRDVWRFEP